MAVNIEHEDASYSRLEGLAIAGTSAPPLRRCDEKTDRILQEARMTTPPDFGGQEIEEGLLEDLGGPPETHPVSHQDQAATDWDDNEAHAAGKLCARCGAVIRPDEDARRHVGGQWMHEACPVTS